MTSAFARSWPVTHRPGPTATASVTFPWTPVSTDARGRSTRRLCPSLRRGGGLLFSVGFPISALAMSIACK